MKLVRYVHRMRRSDNGTRTEPLDESQIRHVLLKGAPKVHLNRVAAQCPPGLVSRGMLLQKSGLTAAELRSLESSGLVKPAGKNGRGWTMYEEALIPLISKKAISPENRPAALPSAKQLDRVVQYTTSEAVLVFGLFRQGMALEDIILETHIHPTVVTMIKRDYEDMTGTLFVSKATLDKVNSLPLDCPLPIKTQEDIYTAMSSIASSIICGRCKVKPKRYCHGCVSEIIAKKMGRNLEVEASQTPTDEESSNPT